MLSRRVAFSGVAFFCVGLIVLVPLPDCSKCRAADPPAGQPQAKKNRPVRRPRPPLLPSSLVGKITDEKGAPVADARLEMYPKDGGRDFMTETKADGSYAFERVPSAAVYHLSIFSTRCVSLWEYRDDGLNIPLDPPKTVTRDFVLKVACQLRLTVIDESGHPVPKVSIYKPGRYDGQFRQTNGEGQITVGGMPPTPLPGRFALQHNDYAIEFVDVKLDDPRIIVDREVTLSAGKSVRGTVTCSDGKPAFGCTILALPSSWDFMAFPNGQPIRADGSFEFPHIGPGSYKISVSVPQGGASSIQKNAISDVELFNRKEPLDLKVDFPSLASMGFISGHIRFKEGRRPKQGFWIQSSSPGSPFLGAGHYVQANETTFKIGPLPHGRYTLQVDSQEIESKELAGIATGTDRLELEVGVRGPSTLNGLVTADEGNAPLKNLRIRLFKTRYLRGRNYSPDEHWQNVADPKGAFTVVIPGPGVYVVEAAADGYAIGRSEPANSDTDLTKELRIKLTKGLRVSGTVVDEVGRPIDGATVLARSQFGTTLPVSANKVPSGVGVSTKDGRFSFEHLNPGQETLRVLHRDYAFAEVKDLELKAGAQPAPLAITMKRGGTVRGRVFDQNGRPAAGVSLRFSNTQYNDFQGTNEFAQGVSDDAGDYQVAHLPESLVYISRGDEWNALGVVRQAVVPSAGKTVRVDFGGIKKVTGCLLVNGAPVANTKVLLSGDNPHFGSMKAYAVTDGEGNFVFRGVPPGERFLYYTIGAELRQKWVRVKPLRIETSNDPFGTIDLVTATLTVHCPPIDPATRSANVSLSHFNPVWFALGEWIDSEPRRDKNDPFVFRLVPIGKYALSGNRTGQLGIRQVIEITGPGEKSISIDWPKGTAALRGKAPAGLTDGRGYMQLRSKDGQWAGSIEIKPNGSFEMAGLPAGEYFLTQQAVIDADAMATFSLAEGEMKTISLTEEAFKQPSNGFLMVKAHTPEGLPLPGCQVTLTGAKGDVLNRTSQSDQVSFSTAPGPYRLAVSYPGFAPVTKQIDVKATQNGRWGTDHQLDLTLVRSTEQTKAEIR
ncbi:MAG TPA: carboxypeptidase-like regulatory domain-containing protein [Planctomycetaceae bacterium]|jgi:protocatechuate 3,4-dioxygenase beta subunit|nr:carboxypeptidase-like regulatory domain-containing protein [Planctomycetaceae bacterium]